MKNFFWSELRSVEKVLGSFVSLFLGILLLFPLNLFGDASQSLTSDSLLPSTVAGLPASPPTNTIRVVTDGLNVSDCTAGAGSERVLCVYNGSAWTPISYGNVGSLVATIDINVGGITFGTTAPTGVMVGTTPEVDVLLLDATAETIGLVVRMPTDWNKAEDCTIYFVWQLVSNETDADELDITIDYVALTESGTGGGISKTSTQLTQTITLTTANGLTAGDVYTSSSTLAAADANNGFAVGDDTVGFAFEWHMTNLTDVASIHWIAGRLEYVRLY